ncbi:MAG: PRC-barrel domain-containing protein [Crocinitomicaceae bacterium]|nr:PRC-barrel domain-containing protein [Crocinitomicaceae bacterium]
MIRLATILFIFGTSFILFGQQALINNIEGQWSIHSEGKKIMLDRSIHELGNFDQAGLSYFMRHEKYGIVNNKGEILVKERFTSIKQLGSGYYLALDSLRRNFLCDWHQGDFRVRAIDYNVELQPSWYRFTYNSSNFLVNLPSQKEWELKKGDVIYESDFDHLQCFIDSTNYFFDPSGNAIKCQRGYPLFAEKYLLILTEEDKSVVYRTHTISIPSDASKVRIRQDEIMYVQSGKSTIISSHDGHIISELPFEDVSYYNDDLIQVRSKGKVGLIKKTGEVVLPAEYASFSMLGDLYYVRKSTGAGIIDENGQVLVPCKYNYIVAYSDFFKIHNDLTMVGLISRKTGRNLLSCDYSRLMLSDSVVRAFTSDMLRIMELDSNHRITNDIILSNVTSLVNTEATENYIVDERLYPLGWFFEYVPQYDSSGFETGVIPRWGLKSSNDSILRPAQYRQPKFVDQADFSLIEMAPRRIKLPVLGEYQCSQSRVLSHRSGKQLIPEVIISIDTLDLLSRSYARFFSPKGHGVLLSDNSILRVNHIDGSDAKYIRYCTSKQPEMKAAEKGDFDALRFYDTDVNNDPENWLEVTLSKKNHEYVKYENAKWNFLTLSGKNLFQEPFDFVKPYASQTAIVQKNDKWGVVRADSFILEPMYASINRSPISDTLLVVKKKVNGKRFLDTNGRVLTNGITRFLKRKGNLTHIEINRRKKLIKSDYSIISGDTKFQKLFDNDIFYSKKKKEYTVYNSNGDQLGSVKLKPEEVWFEEYVLTKGRGKRGVLSMENDTIIPFKYKTISKIGDYIFAQDGNDNLLFDRNLNEIDNLKSNKVLVDSITASYAEIKDTKATTYSSTNEKIGKFKGTKFKHFHNGYLIEFGKTLRVLAPDQEFTFDFQPKEFHPMGENGQLIIDSDKIGHYFDAEWNEVSVGGPLTRAKVVGEGLAISRSRGRTILFGGDVKVVFKEGPRAIETFKNGFLLLQYMGNFEFVDVKGINQFKRSFKDAMPFIGKYATVKEKDGWTIIDGEGHFQILPNFDKITPLSSTLFETTMQPVYGLFDGHGNELIPAEYQQLNFLRNNIIQGRKEGDIFYFDLNGSPISLD